MIFLKDAKSLIAQLAFLGVFNGDILGSNLPIPNYWTIKKQKKIVLKDLNIFVVLIY